MYPRRIWGIVVSDRTVFLTFDDGPDQRITPWLLDFLEREGVQATFFCVGNNVRKHPEIFARILNAGHAVGNHCMHHENGYKTDDAAYLLSIEESSHLIDSRLFRPPYGRMKRSAERKMDASWKIIMWSWLSYDYKRTVAPERILKSAQKIRPGDILVFHDNRKTQDRLKELLPPVVQSLKARNFQFGKL